ncbi:hypothetical protein acsn021_13950 [Anaerocolumna cellulosilytica]|uniref:Uncharacterized protein n=1 Tax=Anaerocolumna cellulosilytica TaxID=433286 RepID=A0A6S6QVV1_9FIRM|nr:hypothetical protein [Anaerocolumna cellulosilytica]MBB5195583.1 hypothetical protein [Anaerocolumna cellulosilytica]BCJ93826.1 hypothetical protein acsn021_13950 [Anaerocolumna cellulosilytica]
MKKQYISCDVCQDLIPLVKDQVASEDSITLVSEHVASCTMCQQLIDKHELSADIPINDKRVLSAIHRKFYLGGLILLGAGTLFGIYLTNSMGIFYNFAVMPLMGALGYFTFRRFWLFVPFVIGIVTFIWTAVPMLQNKLENVILACTFYAAIYAVLCLLGGVAALLLHFAFTKETRPKVADGS